MVYNNVVYKPATLNDKLQAKFGERAANAVFRAGSAKQATAENSSGEVLSFFGRTDDTRTADRAIPSRKRAMSAKAASSKNTVRERPAPVNNPRGQYARREKAAAANYAQGGVRKNTKAQPMRQNVRRSQPRGAVQTGTGVYARAYAAGEQIRRAATEYSSKPRRAYAKGAVPSGALRRGRSNIPGSRHAVLVTTESPVKERNFIQIVKDAFADRHVAEHRVKKAPFPLSFITIVGICAFMVMALIFSFSQVGEYTGNINMLNARQSELAEQAAKLEVKLEERDDIRNIEKIAVERIGMVSSDMVQSKFVSVTADDRVEIYKTEAEEKEGGLSALLSAIGERFGRIGEYFN